MKDMYFVKDKETPNTIRYREEERDDDPPCIRTIYLQKFFVRRLGDPARIKVSVEAA